MVSCGMTLASHIINKQANKWNFFITQANLTESCTRVDGAGWARWAMAYPTFKNGISANGLLARTSGSSD